MVKIVCFEEFGCVVFQRIMVRGHVCLKVVQIELNIFPLRRFDVCG